MYIKITFDCNIGFCDTHVQQCTFLRCVWIIFFNNHMFCSKAGLSKFSSAPYLQARYEEKKDESVEAVESAPNFTSGFTNGGEVRHRHSFNSNYDTLRPSDSSLRETEQKSSGDSVSWGKGVGVSLDKTDSKSSKSPILGGSGISRGKSSSFRESPSPSKTPSRLVERSDSGSRSSTEFVRSHSRERSFEKSLENIMDKCSEKSLDMNVSLESKNGMVSDSSRVEDSSLSAAKKSADKSDKKKKNAPWYTVSIFVVILFLNFFFLYVASIICLASYNLFFFNCIQDYLAHSQNFMLKNLVWNIWSAKALRLSFCHL